MAGTPMPEASFAAASNMAVASPRSFEEIQLLMALAFAGNDRRFPYAQQQPSATQSAKSRRDRGGKKRDAPQEGADAPDAPDAELIEQDADGQLA